jgi:hypothetical protein
MQRNERSEIPRRVRPARQITIQLIINAAVQVRLLEQLPLRRGSLLVRKECNNRLLIDDPKPELIDHEHITVHEYGSFWVLGVVIGGFHVASKLVIQTDSSPGTLP